MAKKRKKTKAEKEEYEFRPPDFDEKEFLKKEMKDTKTLIWTVLYAVLFGIIAGLLMLASEDLLGVAFMVGIAGIVSLKYFYPLIKVDITSFQKKNWLGNIATFFFTFLAIWVLLLNVPISDHAKPAVENVIIWVSDGTTARGMEYKHIPTQGIYGWVPLNSSDTLETMISVSAGATINITAKVTDNGNLQSVVIQVTTSGDPLTSSMLGEEEYRFGFQVNSGELSASSGLTFTITATDKSGNDLTWRPERAAPVAP
ncbi:MAG: hypothetical protein JW880_00605 [Candidatus Thermoplasmatota archaeon]|nr:hypothetical protein [Candidatus Thermoplasmatota archaeon]